MHAAGSPILGLVPEEVARLKVLVVDDIEIMRRLMWETLSGLGVGTIKKASDGAEALRIMRELPPDLVFVDLKMHGMDGFELVKRIRAGRDGANPYMPIIMVTGHTDEGRFKRARDLGVTDILTKPVSMAALAQRINTILHHPRPFIKVPGYFGPDRRRRAQPRAGADRRKAQEGLITLEEIHAWLDTREPSPAT